jgi:hypothetical protein
VDCVGPSPTTLFSLTFDDQIRYDWTDAVHGLEVVGGATKDLVEGDEPVPYKSRGVYFDAGQYFQIENLHMPITHSVTSWVRPTKLGTIYSVESSDGQTELLAFQGDPNYVPASGDK